MSICILHNICIELRDNYEACKEVSDEADAEVTEEMHNYDTSTTSSSDRRNALYNYLVEKDIV